VTLTLTFDLSTENWHSTYSCSRENLYQFLFFYFFGFGVTSPYGTDEQTDGCMGKTCNVAYWTETALSVFLNNWWSLKTKCWPTFYTN